MMAISLDYLSEETDWRSKIIDVLILVGYIKKPREVDQIEKDIKRSLNSFDICKKWDKNTK